MHESHESAIMELYRVDEEPRVSSDMVVLCESRMYLAIWLTCNYTSIAYSLG